MADLPIEPPPRVATKPEPPFEDLWRARFPQARFSWNRSRTLPFGRPIPRSTGPHRALDFEETSLGASPCTGWRAWVKRAIDLVGALVLLALTWPLLLLAAYVIVVDSAGGVFFVQRRVGQYGRIFKVYKLRTMVANAEDLAMDPVLRRQRPEGATYKTPGDGRITRPGRWLRRTSIDELPQLFNVLLGDMSLVGPRPLSLSDLANDPKMELRRLLPRPGITGLSQVSGRSQLTYDQMVQKDLEYLENWSLWSDFKILGRTVWVVLSGRGAY
jgi:lipopolysaccharide/colanic/teichoic acid biosynthesis glycosyltransferase